MLLKFPRQFMLDNSNYLMEKLYLCCNYVLQLYRIKIVQSAKYLALGVKVSHHLKWNTHINKATAKSNRTLGFLKRNLRVKSPFSNQRHIQHYSDQSFSILHMCPRKGVDTATSSKMSTWELQANSKCDRAAESTKLKIIGTTESRRPPIVAVQISQQPCCSRSRG